MMVPLYGFLQGDTLGMLVLAHGDWSMEKVVGKLQSMARIRVPEKTPCAVWYQNKKIPAGKTVAEAGMTALDRIDVRYAP